MLLNTGTFIRHATPRIRMNILCPLVVKLFPVSSAGGLVTFPLRVNERIMSGMIILTRLGKMTLVIIAIVVTCPPIQSMMVVTSPIGDHAPPAFADITIILAKNHLVL